MVSVSLAFNLRGIMKCFIFTFAYFLMFVFNVATFAKEFNVYEFSLEELMNIDVVTASNVIENINESPGVISVINKQAIHAYGGKTLSEIIELSSNIFVGSSYMFPSNAISVRGDIAGQYNVHVLLLLNGRPIREGQNGGTPLAILDAFPIHVIKQVEIIRGAGSVLYGSGAYSGVINVITESPADSGKLIAVEKGSLNATRLSLYNHHEIADWAMSYGLQYYDDKGWNYQGVDEVGVTFSRTYDKKNVGVFFRLESELWKIEGTHADATFGHIGTLPISSLFQNNANIRSKRSILDIEYKNDLTKDDTLQLNLTLNRMKNDYVNPGPQPSYMLAQDYLAELSWRSEITDDLRLITGGSLEGLTGKSAGVNESSNENITIIPKYNEQWLRAYIELSYWLTDSLKLVSGAQVNKPENISANLSKRLSVIYTITENLGIKVQYAEAFRSASLLEKNITLPGIVVGNANLAPEVNESLDLQLLYKKNNYNIGMTVFQNKSTALITRIPDETLGATYINDAEHVDFTGIEFEGKWYLLDGCILDYSFVWQGNTKLDNEQSIVTPKKMHKIGLSSNFQGNANFGIFAFWAADWGSTLGSVKRNPDVSDFLLLQANVTYQWKDFEFSAKASNLLNEDIFQPEYVRGKMNTLPAARNGINFSMTVQYQF